MKKLAIVLVLILLLSLYGCGKVETTESVENKPITSEELNSNISLLSKHIERELSITENNYYIEYEETTNTYFVYIYVTDLADVFNSALQEEKYDYWKTMVFGTKVLSSELSQILPDDTVTTNLYTTIDENQVTFISCTGDTVIFDMAERLGCYERYNNKEI